MVLSDLEQMRRMIGATLGFARSDFFTEAAKLLILPRCFTACAMTLPISGTMSVSAGVLTCRVHEAGQLATRGHQSHRQRHQIRPRARVEYRELAQRVEIIVEDDGPGIPSHLQEEAFRPFRRLGPDCPEVEGSGLGLTIARSIDALSGATFSLLTARARACAQRWSCQSDRVKLLADRMLLKKHASSPGRPDNKPLRLRGLPQTDRIV